MKIPSLWIALIGFALIPIKGTSQTASAVVIPDSSQHQKFNHERLLQHVRILSDDSLQGRRTATDGAKMARVYIKNQLDLLKIRPLGEHYEQNFSFKALETNYQGNNLLAQVKGTEYPDKYIVLSAHYDHEGVKNGKIYNGADDDASGVAGLLAFAEYFQENPPKHSVILAFFDAEELGLQGSKYYVDHPIVPSEHIAFNINLDMISRNKDHQIYAVGVDSAPSFKAVILKNTDINGIKILIGHDGSDKMQDWTYSSDHGSFHRKGIPFLYFGVEDHEDYHQPTDDFENIQPDFFTNVVESIITIFEQLDR